MKITTEMLAREIVQKLDAGPKYEKRVELIRVLLNRHATDVIVFDKLTTIADCYHAKLYQQPQ